MLNWISPAFLKRWARLERDHAAKGQLAQAKGADVRVYSAIFQAWDARLGESLASQRRVHPLHRSRALLFRGRLKEARAELGRLGDPSPAARPEVLLERARISGAEGVWGDVLAACDEALKLMPAPVTHLALTQCRSVAFFELGDFQKAVEELDRIESLATCLPHSCLILYGAATRAKILARDRGWQAARALLDRLWADTARNPNIDATLSLLRTECDARRICGKSSFENAVAGYLVAAAMGDRLYRDLGLIDVAHGCAREVRAGILADLRESEPCFRRVRSLLDELDGAPRTSTAVGFLKEAPGPLACAFPAPSQIDRIALCHARQVIDLRTLSVRSYSTKSRPFKAVELLKTGSVSKEELFRRFWGIQKFVRELHDGAVRTLLCRVRKELGLEVDSSSGELEMPRTWVVGNGEHDD